MKKTILLTVTLALLLTACGSNAAEAERGVDTKRSFFHQSQSTHAAETEDTIYFVGATEQHIKYVDKETGISGPLCGKPECDHDGQECNAWVYLGVDCLFVNDGRLYWIGDHYPHSAQQPYSLFSTALDGTDRREVRLSDELPLTNVSNPIVLVEDGYLYVSLLQSSIEDGNEVTYQKIVAQNLDDDMSVATILDEEAPTGNHSRVSMQFYDGWLYFMTCEGPWGAGEHRFRLRRWNAATGETETLYDEPNSRRLNWITDMWVDDQGVLFMAYNNETDKMGMYRYGFTDDGLTLVCDTGVTGTVRGGIADGIVSGFTLEENGENYDFHVVIRDFEGQTLLDETYGLDLAETGRALMDGIYGAGAWNEEGLHWNIVSGDMLGRDETNAYYAFEASYIPAGKNGRAAYHITVVIQVPLDGSGAKVLCTVPEKI